jgi:hypothetical protein
MALEHVQAFATTGSVQPGTEQMGDDGVLRVRQRLFVDTVESDDPRMAGTNEVLVDLDIRPSDGTGTLAGHFTLITADGSWRGELRGALVGGQVRSTGLARGAGAYEGSVLALTFRQVEAHPERAPVDDPMAFFEMQGQLLS